ncbi:hypothetical protein HOY80DRAFT_1025481 [Tuber brumale]|nr:hypothetical protein HOY80DRAFT_1025481 [Tuber brumale]
MFRLSTKLARMPTGIYRYPPQVRYASKATSTILHKNRSTNIVSKTAYWKVTLAEAEKRLGFMFMDFERQGISASQMLAEAKPEIEGLRKDQVQETKEKVYHHILEFLECEGYPTESVEDFQEANINDLVFTILAPIVADFRRKTGRNFSLLREKQITALDSQT